MCQERIHVYRCSCKIKKLHHCQHFRKELRNRGCLSTLVYAFFPREHCGRLKQVEARHEHRSCNRCRNGFRPLPSPDADKRIPYELVMDGEDPTQDGKAKKVTARPVRKDEIRVIPNPWIQQPILIDDTPSGFCPNQAVLDTSSQAVVAAAAAAAAFDPGQAVFGSTKTRHHHLYHSGGNDDNAALSEQWISATALPEPPPRVFRLPREQPFGAPGGTTTTQRPRRDRVHGPPPPAMYNRPQARAASRSSSKSRQRRTSSASSSSSTSAAHGGHHHHSLSSSSVSSSSSPSTRREAARLAPPAAAPPTLRGKRSPAPAALDLRAAHKPSTSTRLDRSNNNNSSAATSATTAWSSSSARLQPVDIEPPPYRKGYADAPSAMAASLASMQIEADRVAALYAMHDRRAAAAGSQQPASAGPYCSRVDGPPPPRPAAPLSARLPTWPVAEEATAGEEHQGKLPEYALKRPDETFRGYAAWAEREDRHRRDEKKKNRKVKKGGSEPSTPSAAALFGALAARRGLTTGGSGVDGDDGSDALSEASFACADARRIERRGDDDEVDG